MYIVEIQGKDIVFANSKRTKTNTVWHKNFVGFLFCGWRFFAVCWNKFLWFETTEISGGNKFLRFSVQVAEYLRPCLQGGRVTLLQG